MRRRLASRTRCATDSTLLTACAGLLFLLSPLHGLEAQEAEWEIEGELGASVFFGNTSQTTFNTRLATSRADSVYDLSTQSSFSYGEAENRAGESFVVKRAWDAEVGLDWRPFATLSPFLFGQGESSFEWRIDFRYNAGGGGKYTFVRDERSRVDLSLALLAEQTFVSEEAPEEADLDSSVLARWSLRFRARRELSEGRVILSTENSYRPVLDDFENYVMESQNSVSYALSEVLSLKVSFLDIYDSQATVRGADTNNDGQFLFSLLATF